MVGIDGFIDGLTLGIALNVGVKEAALIAVAMTLEMCFVGVVRRTVVGGRRRHCFVFPDSPLFRFS